MAKQNPFLAKQEALRLRCFEIACDTTSQQFFDYMCIVLNDPEIMGKDVFGANRLLKVMEAMRKLDKEYSEAWCGSQDSDYYQEKIEILRKPIFPHELVDPTEAVADYLLDNGVTVRERGRWEKIAHYPYYCSICGEIAPLDFEGESHYKSDFCPVCGSDMRGEEDGKSAK